MKTTLHFDSPVDGHINRILLDLQEPNGLPTLRVVSVTFNQVVSIRFDAIRGDDRLCKVIFPDDKPKMRRNDRLTVDVECEVPLRGIMFVDGNDGRTYPTSMGTR